MDPVLATIALPAWTTIAAVVISSLLGAEYGARRGFDVIGVLGLALAQGVGGLVLRDVLLQAGTPVVLEQPEYLLGAAAAAVVGFFFAGLITRARKLLVGLEALAIGFFATAGATSALAMALSWPAVTFIGTITAVGGLVLRDVLAGNAPLVLRPGAFIAVAAVAGTGVFQVLVAVGVDAGLAQVVAIATVFALRLLSLAQGWETHAAVDFSDRVWGLWRRRPSPADDTAGGGS